MHVGAPQVRDRCLMTYEGYRKATGMFHYETVKDVAICNERNRKWNYRNDGQSVLF